VNWATINAAIPHTHRNRTLSAEEQRQLRKCRARKVHREAEREIKDHG
jgi:hypothetical protein